MTDTASSPETSDARRDALVERLFMAAMICGSGSRGFAEVRDFLSFLR